MKTALLGCLSLLLATQAFAHRLDECLQASRISVSTNRIDLTLELTPGVAIANEWLVGIDKDQNGKISEAESAAYAHRVLKGLQMGLDEKVVNLSLVETIFPAVPDIRSGLGVVRIKATTAMAPLAEGEHVINLTNGHLPTISVYQVNAMTPKDRAIQITKQTRDELQRNYRLEFSVKPTPPQR